MISVVLIVLTLGSALIGCSDNSSDNGQGSFSDDVKLGNNIGGSSSGGSIVVPTEDKGGTLNPVFTDLSKANLATNILYTPLYLYEGMDITYGLANSVEFKDNKELTIKMKEGLVWHDGKPITVDDVIYTLNLILDESQGSMLRPYLMVNDTPITIKKEDDFTIKVNLPYEKAGFLHNLSRICPIPKHVYESEKLVASSKKNDYPIGSGPFKYKEGKEGEYITFVRFDEYVGGKPKAESITIKVIPKEKQQEALEKEEICLMEATNELYKKSEEKNSKYQNYSHCAGKVNFLAFNENTEIMKDANVRKAISFALNRKGIIAAAYGGEETGAKEAKTILLPSTDFYYDGESIEGYEQDVEKAKEYLKKASAHIGKLFLGYCTEEEGHKKYAQEIQRQLKESDIQVEIMAYDKKAFQDVLVNKKEECNLYVTGYELGGNPEAYRDYFESDAFLNQWGYSNKDIDDLWEAADGEQDNEKRKKIYTDIQLRLAEDAAIYPINYERKVMVALNKVRGIDSADPRGGGLLFRDWSKLYITK